MIHPLRLHYDKLLLAFALALLLGSGSWVRRQQTEVRSLHAVANDSGHSPETFVPGARRPPVAIVPHWTVPHDQERGDGWVYEVFTPPLFKYNSATQSFALMPPEPMAGAADTKALSSEPQSEVPPALRLQLRGYVGSPDDCLVIFQSLQSADTMVVRVGHRFADLQLTLKAFAVRKVLATETESGPVYEAAALATLFDERSGQEVVLDIRTRPITAQARAQTAANPESLPAAEVRRVAVNSP